MYSSPIGSGAFPLVLLLLSLSFAASGETFNGLVVRVIEGDTLMLTGEQNRLFTVKLSGIETQPSGSPAGRAARRHLEMLVLGRQVKVTVRQRQTNTPILGKLTHGGADINLRLLQAGLGRFQPLSILDDNDRRLYIEAEQRAKARGMGIWQAPPGSRR